MTGALLLAAALALDASVAFAGFRYVPPEPPPAADELPEPAVRGPVPLAAGAQGAEAGGPAAGPGTRVSGTSVSHTSVSGTRVSGTSVSGTSVWGVREGEMLRAALARWGARAGVEILFLTDRRYRLEAAADFEGGFMDAVQALLRGLSHLPHPPVAARAEGAALVVRHRMRVPAQEEEAR